MAFALNKKTRRRERRLAKKWAEMADRFEREMTRSPELITMVRELAADAMKYALRKKRRRKKIGNSN
jgi:hypothetical protein